MKTIIDKIIAILSKMVNSFQRIYKVYFYKYKKTGTATHRFKTNNFDHK